MWRVFEPVHAVTYFAPEITEAYSAIGLKGFWMGYFAGRSAPFGEASPALVTATFFNFRPSMVERALPDAWALASPGAVLRARLESAETALRRLFGDQIDDSLICEAASLAEEAVAACSVGGRALFAALTEVEHPASPLGRLWHATTLLREHRGDGHVIANVAHGVNGLGSHVLQVASGAVPRARLQAARGWTDDEWEATATVLASRGWLAEDGRLTNQGRAGHAAIAELTDRLAAEPWVALGPERTERLHDLLASLAPHVVGDHAVPGVSPIGDLREPG